MISKSAILGLALVFFSMASSSVKAGKIAVTIKTTSGDTWTDDELAFVKKAASIAFDRIVTVEVANCAYRNSYRDSMSAGELKKRWGNQIPVLNKGERVTLRVRKGSFERRVLGAAAIGIAEVDRGDYAIYDLDISLNQENLNDHVAAYSKRSGASEDEILNKWVSVIAHEVAHNFGYTHGSSGTWSEDYPGYFVTELGFCTMTNGKYGSDLGDEALRRARKG